jgi:malate dehydrogenase (oxaloacetate-decarboxylating)(NADP+)
MNDTFYKRAIDYHRYPVPGKMCVVATKPLATQEDLSLAYSPGVAAPCQEIVAQPHTVRDFTSRGNLVGVITNGTAVLGLGNIGPLAAKPVMEGKAVLFKKFAGIDVFDLEIDESDPERLIETIARLEPTFGAINLEDIKAPECFYIESELQKRMSIPVFHDDQHGTAIIVAAAVQNGLELVGKALSEVKIVTSGAGAAAIACLNLLEKLGAKRENIFISDQDGVVYEGRPKPLDSLKAAYVQDTPHRTLSHLMEGADIFLGLSVRDVVTEDMLVSMAPRPLIFALANPHPEIDPVIAKKVRPDGIIATGRSDFPNQVNNVLCFPFIFRGALDVGATCINNEMKIACVEAIASLAKAEISDIVANAYGQENIHFGPEYIIPKPFDPRLILEIAPAVALAAMKTGVAKYPIDDMEAYSQSLKKFIYRSDLVMRPVFSKARSSLKKITYADGEDERILRAVQMVLDDRLASPILIGRPHVIEGRIEKLGLRMKAGLDFEIVDPQGDPRYHDYWTTYHELAQRQGIDPHLAKVTMRTNNSVIAATMLYRGETDGVLCGPVGRFSHHLADILPIIGLKENVPVPGAISLLISDTGNLFVTDSYVNYDPSAEELVHITQMAAHHVKSFGIDPKIALISHSSFGSSQHPSAAKMRQTYNLLKERFPELDVEGEMHADASIDLSVRDRMFPNSSFKGKANILVMPNLDTAHVSFNLAKSVADALPVGPCLMGLKKPLNILISSSTVRRIVNMTAITLCQAQSSNLQEG